MRSNRMILATGLVVILAACIDQGAARPSTAVAPPTTSPGSDVATEHRIAAVQAFETALWSGDVDTALTHVAEGFTYSYPFETISGPEDLRNAFGEFEDPGFGGEIQVQSSGFTGDGDTLTWTSIRYFPGSFGQAAALTATFEGNLIASISESGALTAAVDAIGCDNGFPYSWHGDYGPEAVGISDDPVSAAVDGLPEAQSDVEFEELDGDIESPISGGHGPVVRASWDGYTVGFVFLTEREDGSLLIDGVTACDGYLEQGFGDEEHGDVIHEDDPGMGDDQEPSHEGLEADASGAAPTGGTPLPDFEQAIAGDDGSGPLPVGSVTSLPDSVQLDFLFEFCLEVCFRDAHFLDPDDPNMGSGPFRSDMPFHVRHGFPASDGEPLGEGFDVVIYVTSLGGQDDQATYRYTSDYVVQGRSEACGPSYRSQTEPVTCQWFVHEFDDGLPAWRHALWAVWEAPCSAWVDYGFIDGCSDPTEVLGLFSSGVDSPFNAILDYDEANERP